MYSRMKTKILLFLMASLLIACGDGGGADNNALISGNYQVHQAGDAAAVAVIDTARVDITADGAGSGTMNIAAGNHSGGTTASGAFSYSVASNRTASINTSAGSIRGIVSADGNLIVLSDADRTVNAVPPLSDAGIVLAAGLKKTSGQSVASLSGDYQIHQFGNGGSGAYTAKVARVNIHADGFGAGTWATAAQSEAGPLGSGTFTYTVSPADGTFSVVTEVVGPVTIGTDHGIISTDGSLFLLTDTNPTPSAVAPIEESEIIMAVGIKKSIGLTNTILKGNYQINQIGDAGLGRSAAQVDITADGAGSGTWSITASSSGGSGSGIFNYTVAPDGTFSVTTKDVSSTITIGTDYGIISADGSVFVLSDANPLAGTSPSEDSEIVLAVGVRQ